MAEIETAVLDPIAETVSDEQEPFEETEALSDTETGAETDPETETFSKEQVEERVAEARREAQEAIAEVRRTAEQQEAAKYWSEDVYREGMRFFRNVAGFGAKQANEKGVTPDEAAGMVQAVHVKQFLDEFAEKSRPVLTGEVHRSHLSAMENIIQTRYPDWKPSKDAADKFKEATNSGKADVAIRGMLDYLTAAHDESKTKAVVAAELEKTKKATEVARLQKTGTNGGPAKIAGAASIAKPADVISDPNATDAQKRAAFEKAYGFTPNF